MITVVVYINEKPIFTRSARNITDKNVPACAIHKYKCDTGDILMHQRDKGFVPLVKKMLDTIDEKDL